MKIYWSHNAQQQQETTADYILNEFGQNAVMQFYDRIEELETSLLHFPEMGKFEPLLTNRSIPYRSFVMSKFNKIIYYIDNDTIYVIDFWDTRREPSDLVRTMETGLN